MTADEQRSYLHVFTVACGNHTHVDSFATGLISSIHAGLSTAATTLKPLHMHLLHDGAAPAKNLIHLMERASSAQFLKPMFKFTAEPPKQTTMLASDTLATKTGNRACGTSRLMVPQWFPNLDSALYIDADCFVLGDIRLVFEHFSRFNATQWLGLALESESGINYYTSRAKRNAYGTQGVNTGVLLMNLTRMRHADLIRYAHAYRGSTAAGDQDIVNAYLNKHSDEFYQLPCELNRRDYRFNSMERDQRYSSNCDAPAWTEPGIIHGNGHAFDDGDIDASRSWTNGSDPESPVRVTTLATAFYRLRPHPSKRDSHTAPMTSRKSKAPTDGSDWYSTGLPRPTSIMPWWWAN